MTLEEMRSHLVQLMKPSGMTATQVKEHLAGLSQLKRWLGNERAAAND